MRGKKRDKEKNRTVVERERGLTERNRDKIE